MTKSTGDSKPKTYTRFDIVQRIQHIIFLISFTVLGFTGLPQEHDQKALVFESEYPGGAGFFVVFGDHERAPDGAKVFIDGGER